MSCFCRATRVVSGVVSEQRSVSIDPRCKGVSLTGKKNRLHLQVSPTFLFLHRPLSFALSKPHSHPLSDAVVPSSRQLKLIPSLSDWLDMCCFVPCSAVFLTVNPLTPFLHGIFFWGILCPSFSRDVCDLLCIVYCSCAASVDCLC
jgi:hypothetical protein